MNGRKFRVLLLCSHPAQYSSPMWRRIAQHPEVDILVAYCSLEGAETHTDPDFGVEVAWDIPLLDGYPWTKLRNISPWPRAGKFFGLINPGIWRLVRSRRFDAVALFTGYNCATFWMAVAATKFTGVPVLFGADAHDLSSRDRRNWKKQIKKILWPRLFRLADIVIVPSSGAAALMRSLRILPERIMLTPYAVDNEWWIEQANRTDRLAVRCGWGVPADASVALFCAKLQPWKRPDDLLRAFARAKVPGSYLIVAGDGSMKESLQSEAVSLGVKEHVRFLGFVNQSQLPGIYSSSDLFILPSEYEPFGVVVNEAMLCGCAVVVSDRVGARFDLVDDGKTGFLYPVGNVNALAAILSQSLSDRARLRAIGEAARQRMSEWSPTINVESTICAIKKAIHLKHSVRDRS